MPGNLVRNSAKSSPLNGIAACSPEYPVAADGPAEVTLESALLRSGTAIAGNGVVGKETEAAPSGSGQGP